MASILDISRLTGVSKSTVQRVISGTGSFSEDVARKVLEAAKELNYRPNGLARAIRTKQTNIIGVIVYRKHMPIISHPFYGPILDAMASELKRHGYGILLIPDSEVSTSSGDWLIEHRVDGMVLMSHITQPLISYFKDSRIPFVLINNSDMVEGTHYIVNDDFQGAYDATRYLVQQGYRRIAFVSGPIEHRSYRMRLQGFNEAIADSAARPFSVYSGDSALETGSQAAKRFLAMADGPDAIFASNDMMAIGILKELLQRGLTIPRDMALVGFDDIDYARLTTPELTTVQVDKGAMGRMAVEKLMSIMNDPTILPAGTVLPPKLIVRQSTGSKFENPRD